jgi:hypothetical protein
LAKTKSRKSSSVITSSSISSCASSATSLISGQMARPLRDRPNFSRGEPPENLLELRRAVQRSGKPADPRLRKRRRNSSPSTSPRRSHVGR